jgi:hypothetical protein
MRAGRRQRYLLGVLGAMTMMGADVVSAQAPNDDPLGSWMTARSISIRKTFDGTKEEQNPARLFWLDNPTFPEKSATLTDVAVKISQKEFEPWFGSQLLLYPVGEYHRTTATSKPTNTASATGKVELRPFGLSVPDGPPMVGPFFWIAPLFVGDAKLSRDFETAQWADKFAAQMTLTSLRTGLPGSQIRTGTTLRGRYYPYVGVERYHNRTAGLDTVGTFGLLRLWAELWPIASGVHQYLQLTGDWSGRKRTDGSLGGDDYLRDLALGANLYFDGKGHLGVGVEYARGNDNQNGFIFREQTSAGLRIKF